MTKTFRDWRKWRDGLRSCVMRAGATAITTQLTTWMGTNAVANTFVSLKSISLSWETAVISLCVQFGFHCLFAAASYIQNNPDPPTTTEEVDTGLINKPKT